jgi:two-component system OmpR family sensor kinase
MLSRIFMPYYWHTPGTPDESAGMGLAVCRKIVEFHGGSIWAESVVGERVGVSLLLPAAERGGKRVIQS